MRVPVALIVVQVRGTEASLSSVKRRHHTIAQMRVTNVQAYADVVEVSGTSESRGYSPDA